MMFAKTDKIQTLPSMLMSLTLCTQDPKMNIIFLSVDHIYEVLNA
jgi:hypothetical protein